MKHQRESYNRKQKYKNKHYDEGERRRGKRFYEETDEEDEKVPKIRKAKKKERKEVVQETKKEQLVSLKPPTSLRPPVRKEYKAPEKRSAEEIRLIKEEFSRRFKESLRERKNSEDAD